MEDDEICGKCLYLQDYTQQQYEDIQAMLKSFNPLDLPDKQDQQILVPRTDSDQKTPLKIPLQPTSRQQAEYSKAAILSLNQKLKLMQFMQKQIQQLKDLLQQSHKSANDLQASAQQTFSQLNKEIEDHQSGTLQVKQDIENLDKLLQEQENKVAEIQNTIFRSDQEMLKLESQAESIRKKVADVQEVKAEVKQKQTDLTESEKQRFKLYQEVVAASRKFLQQAKGLSSQASTKEKENADLRNEIQQLREQLQTGRKQQYDLKRNKHQKLASKLKLQTTKILAQEDKRFHLSYRAVGERYEQMIQDLTHDLQHSLAKYEQMRKILAAQDQQIKISIADLQNHIGKVENRINIQEAIILDFTQNNQNLQQTNSNYQDVLSVDVRYSFNPSTEQFIDQSSHKLLAMSDLFLLQAYKIKVAQRSALHLKQLVCQLENDIFSIEQTAVSEQARNQVYYASSRDELEQAVERVISGLSGPLRQGFVRLPDGYMFGSKRLDLVLEGGNVYVQDQNRKITLANFLNQQ